MGAQLFTCRVRPLSSPGQGRQAGNGETRVWQGRSTHHDIIALLDQTKAWSSSGKADASITARARQRTKAPSKQAGPSLAGRKATGAVVAGRDFSMAQAEELHAEDSGAASTSAP